MRIQAQSARWLVIIALLTYWALSLNRLDALPTVREDEPWQTAPGYSLWTRGVYGSELFADFAHMGERYYLFQPTFSILLGLAARLWGLGLFQIRIVPVALGALTICLTYIVGARLAGRTVGAAAIFLMLLWRWSVSTPVHASGVTLLDESRIARYDTLVPVWGMAACYLFLIATQSQRMRYFFLAGIFVGLAGLAHLYGLFWLPAFALVLLWQSGLKTFHERPLYLLIVGALVIWTPWLIYITSGWGDFVAQTAHYANRFDLLNPNFYLDNIWREPQRYGLARTTLSFALLQPGVWLLWLGAPLSLFWLWRRLRCMPALRALAVPALLFPVVFALLLKFKIVGYLLSVLPLFALLVAYCSTQWWRLNSRPLRALMMVGALLLSLDSALGIVYQQRLAAQSTSYHEFMREVRAIVPRPARVVALHQYWLGLAENDFRSYTDLIFLTNARYTPTPQTIDQALELIAPEVFIVDAILGDVIARSEDTADFDSQTGELASRYHAYMTRHRARELGQVNDKTYGTLIVYALSP